jgi:hypothetical protein
MGDPPQASGHHHQWELNRRNFQGRWCGTSQWFLRDAQGGLDLQNPSRVIEGTCYAIDFSDDDTGLWDGSGLLFAPDGRRRLPLSKAAYNSTGQGWQFAGAGGQSSLAVDPAQSRFGHELNLFLHGPGWRSRSMLVLLWAQGQGEAGAGAEPQLESDGVASPVWRLDAVGAVPFRCGLSPAAEPPRPQRPWQEVLAEQRGWPGQLEQLEPGAWPSFDPRLEPCEPFDPDLLALERPGGGLPLVAGCVDGLVFAVPEVLPAAAFRLQVGCRLAADRFDLISIAFGDDQRLRAWERRRFSPVGG